ncbi:hypothetical protein ABB37_03178 [Leptomonas pyrrhocoris]|uniref:Uncharacterized protein n=1 Tax=Leptomonas pyrrhocoris TaxID=157538 RepID=A0A0M9G4K6_LEPPY|nr:hypothetical protein ABB37_03178 [Leptomonas pyrrhocoris]KPA81999.1 hypothetical protein ABB37_03178 [Leptomonas pyrrhocoris]|eukprot:XP_015660438.1 hypothetical protein ABB37_03178 [Leptomonas pyrrhocoris]
MSHRPTNVCSPLFCTDRASQQGAAEPTTPAPLSRTRPAIDTAIAAPHSTTPASLTAGTAAAFDGYVEAHSVAGLRTSRCVNPDRTAERGACHRAQQKEDAERQEYTPMWNDLTPLSDTAETTVAQPPAFPRRATSGRRRRQSTLHVTTATNAAATHSPPSVRDVTSTVNVHSATTLALCPSIWPCFSPAQSEAGRNTAPLPFPPAAVGMTEEKDHDGEDQYAKALISPAPANGLVVSGPDEDDGDDDTSRFSDDLRGGAREAAVPARAAVTETLSPCLSRDGWARTSLLRSPLAASLQPLAPATTRTTMAAKDQTASAAALDHYADGTPSSLLDRPLSCYYGLSPRSPSISVAYDAAGPAVGGSWEAKRVHRISAMRRSHSYSLTSPCGSIGSFLVTLGSPTSEARSNSGCGRDSARESGKRKSTTTVSPDAPAFYWSPHLHASWSGVFADR